MTVINNKIISYRTERKAASHDAPPLYRVKAVLTKPFMNIDAETAKALEDAEFDSRPISKKNLENILKTEKDAFYMGAIHIMDLFGAYVGPEDIQTTNYCFSTEFSGKTLHSPDNLICALDEIVKSTRSLMWYINPSKGGWYMSMFRQWNPFNEMKLRIDYENNAPSSSASADDLRVGMFGKMQVLLAYSQNTLSEKSSNAAAAHNFNLAEAEA